MLAHQLAGRLEDSLGQAHAGELLGVASILGGFGDLGVEVDRIADQPLGVGGQVLDLGVPRVAAVIENRDRPLHQVQPGRVRQLESAQRMLGQHGGIVDRDLLTFDVAVRDRQHRRALPGERHRRLDAIFEELSDVGGLGGGGDPFGWVHDEEVRGLGGIC